MDEMCVVCCNKGHNLVSIFDKSVSFEGVSIAEMMKSHEASVNVTNSHAALFICDSCTQKLSTAYKFIQECTESMIKRGIRSVPTFVDTGTQTEPQKLTLIVNNITSQEVTEAELKHLFDDYGNIRDICIIEGSAEKCARITYDSESSALRAFRAAQAGDIKYKNKKLAVTNVSDECTPADILTNHCLQKIFSYFTIDDRLFAELVCKRWYENCLPGWYRETYCFLGCNESTEDKERVLIRCGHYLQDLCLYLSDDDDTTGIFANMAKHCTNLEKLEITCLNNQPTISQFLELVQVFKQCENLRRLCLQNANANFHWESFGGLPSDMIEIHIDSGRWGYEDTLKASIDLSKFKNLQALSLINLNFDLNDLKGIEELSNLIHFRLEQSSYHLRDVEVIQRFRKLELLALTNCDVDDDFLINVLRKNKKIKDLDISNNSNLTGRSFLYLARLRFLKRLKVKNLQNITDTHLSTLHQIIELNCSGCRSVKDWGLMTLIDSSTYLLRLTALDCSVTARLIASANESVEMHHERLLCLTLNKELVTTYKPLVNYQKLVLGCIDDDSDLEWGDWYIN